MSNKHATNKILYLATVLLYSIINNVCANDLPDLGDVSQASISLHEERQLGLQIMSEIRTDSSYLDDTEITGYLTNLGNKLIAGSSEARPDQTFEFFSLTDPSVNAFALPGGFMGFNSGLIMTAQSESELAGVMAHEISHVTQKHLARMISTQKYSMATTLASLALAVLASRANSQAGAAVMAVTQATAIQLQLNFTRDHEKEADRIGLNVLINAGFDPRGMSTFFGRLQTIGRFQDNGAPSYLRTHPLTFERIADIDNRIQNTLYRQVPDSIDFRLVRAKLRASEGKARDAVMHFDANLRDKRYNDETVERYGLVNALLRDGDFVRASKELMLLYESPQPDSINKKSGNLYLGVPIQVERKALKSNAMIETLSARVKLSTGEIAEALDIYQAALQIYPQHRTLIYDYATALLRNGRKNAALKFLSQELLSAPNDARLYKLQAQSYEALGNNMLQHRAQAEVYFQQGDLHAAITQLETGLKTGDGDFYQMSGMEARLKKLREIAADGKKKSNSGNYVAPENFYSQDSGRYLLGMVGKLPFIALIV